MFATGPPCRPLRKIPILEAIEKGNYEKLNELLKPGVHAINGSIIPGFIAREALEVAVKHPQANLKIIKLILKYGPKISEYQYNRQGNGKTALCLALNHSQPNIEIIRVLIKNGADVNQVIYESECWNPYNALHCVADSKQSYKKEIFQYFIEEVGMDPFIRDMLGNNVFYNAVDKYPSMLSYVCSLIESECVPNVFGEEMTKIRQEKTEALEYLLRLPQFQQYQDEHPQTTYLKQWFLIPMFEMPQILLSPEFKRTNLLEEALIQVEAKSQLHGYIIKRLLDLPVTIYFSPVSLCINSLLWWKESIQKYILKFLESLVKNGFRVDEPGSISPLSIVIFQYQKGFLLGINDLPETVVRYITQGGKAGEEVKSELVDVAKFLIEKGAHVGQSIVPFPTNLPEFETLRQDLFLPDAVYAAFESACFSCLHLVLPYFAQPPLTLLLLTKPDWSALVNAMFPILCKGGPIPPGSRYLNDLISHLQRMNAELKIDHVYHKFLEMHSSPPSLMHLSRCVIRSSFAERVSQPGESLPELMRSLEIPVELKEYLEMPAPKRLDVFYCDDPIMARIANEQIQQLRIQRKHDLASDDEIDVDSDDEYDDTSSEIDDDSDDE